MKHRSGPMEDKSSMVELSVPAHHSGLGLATTTYRVRSGASPSLSLSEHGRVLQLESRDILCQRGRMRILSHRTTWLWKAQLRRYDEQ